MLKKLGLLMGAASVAFAPTLAAAQTYNPSSTVVGYVNLPKRHVACSLTQPKGGDYGSVTEADLNGAGAAQACVQAVTIVDPATGLNIYDSSTPTQVSDAVLRMAYNAVNEALQGGGFLVGGTYDNANPSFGNGAFIPAQYNNRGRQKIVLSGRDSSGDISNLSGLADADLSGTSALATGAVGACTDTISTVAAEDAFRALRISCGSQRVLTQSYETRPNRWSYTSGTSPLTATGDTQIVAGVSGKYHCVDAVQIKATTLTTATYFVIRNDTAILWAVPIGTEGLLGGLSVPFPSPFCTSSGNQLQVGLTVAPTTGSVTYNIQGHTTR